MVHPQPTHTGTARTRLFGTLFYSNYLTRALALYRSLEEHFRTDFTLVMLCMDEAALRIVEQLRLPHVEAMTVAELERHYPELSAVKPERSIAEYSWTCTPFLLRHLLDRTGAGNSVVYLDADLMFFSDPQPIFDEWAGQDIVIHAHRYAPNQRHHENNSGIFNVGWVGVRNTPQGRQCMERWASQCIDECVNDTPNGLCGDQKYLDEWPALYDRLVVMRHKGAGLGPWNIEQYEMTAAGSVPQVDGMPVIFYHYSVLRILHSNLFGHLAIIPALGYHFTPIQLRLIYRAYATRLRAAYKELRATPAGRGWTQPWPTAPVLRAALRQRVLIV
jgi:hypothetical protein